MESLEIKMKYMLEIKIKYMHEDTKRLQKIEQGDWIDVYADTDIAIDEGEYALIPLGFACQLPEGYEAHLAPRSSTFKNWGIIITNSFGIIDESYCGDNHQWYLPVFCLKGKEEYSTGQYFEIRKRTSYINRGDKIAQFRIMKKMPPVSFTEVEHLNNSDRGGIGSTGTR